MLYNIATKLHNFVDLQKIYIFLINISDIMINFAA